MKQNQFSHAVIKGISYVIPSNIHKTLDDKIEYFGNDKKKLNRACKIIGYGDTYISPNGLTAVDMCEYAANDLIKNINIDISTIDAIIFVSQSPDYKAPCSAQVLHGRLGLSQSCIAIDINQGCTGYVYGLHTSFAYIESKVCQRVLLLAGDNISEDYISSGNKTINLLFSSSGSATLIEYSEECHHSYFTIDTIGKYYDTLIVPAGGERIPLKNGLYEQIIYDKDGNPHRLTDAFIDGLSTFDFTITSVPKHIKECIMYSNINNIDFFAIHQGNKQIVKSIASKADIDIDKIFLDTFTRYGNTSSTSCLSNLLDKYEPEYLNNNSLNICFVSFGIGLSIASAIIRLNNIYSSGIILHHFDNIQSQDDAIKFWKEKIENYTAD